MPTTIRRRLSSRAGDAPVAPSAGPRWCTLIGMLLLFLPSTSAPTAAPPSQMTKINSGTKLEYNGGVLDTMPDSMWRGTPPCGSGLRWGFRKAAFPEVRGGGRVLSSQNGVKVVRQYLGQGVVVRPRTEGANIIADAHRAAMWAVDPGSLFYWFEVGGLAAAIATPDLGAMPTTADLPPEAGTISQGRVTSGFCQSGMILVFGGVVKELSASLGPPTQAAAGTFVVHAPSPMKHIIICLLLLFIYSSELPLPDAFNNKPSRRPPRRGGRRPADGEIPDEINITFVSTYMHVSNIDCSNSSSRFGRALFARTSNSDSECVPSPSASEDASSAFQPASEEPTLHESMHRSTVRAS